jgi:pSer/pThr/pTyr-binding forkhead associated (FHA) protein
VPGQQLRVVDGPAAGGELPVDRDFTIGRSETGPGNLGNDPEISRQHARFRLLDSGDVLIEDLGSTNGTFVNGERIAAPRMLAPGDTIKMGQTTVQFGDASQGTMVTPPPAAAPVQPPPPAPVPQAAAAGDGQPRRRLPLVLGVAVCLAGVVGAVIALASTDNGKSKSKSETTAGSAAATTPVQGASTSPASSGSKKTVSAGKVTPIGSKLKLGDTAVIAYTDASNHKKSTIEITPSPVERGSISDFKNVQLNAEQKSSTPFYVKVSVKNVGKGDLSGGSPATYIDGVDDRGQNQTSVIFFGNFSRCPDVRPKHLKPGESYNTCLTYLIAKGGSIVGMRWVVFDQKTGKSDLNWR